MCVCTFCLTRGVVSSSKHGPWTMDLLEDILAIGRTLSAEKIKRLIDSIANRIPYQFLPTLGRFGLARENNSNGSTHCRPPS